MRSFAGIPSGGMYIDSHFRIGSLARGDYGWLTPMADAELTFDARVHPVHLTDIDALAERYPDLTIVIDHAAKPSIAAGRDRDAWMRALGTLARHPSVYCKLSGQDRGRRGGARVECRASSRGPKP